jgi:hypothetical protein
VDRRQRLEFENTKGAPVASEKADHHGTTIKKIREVDEATASASKAELGRPFTALYGLGDETRFG